LIEQQQPAERERGAAPAGTGLVPSAWLRVVLASGLALHAGGDRSGGDPAQHRLDDLPRGVHRTRAPATIGERGREAGEPCGLRRQRAAWPYEYDHLVPLELGGAADDPRNLWPEPGASPNPKDALEDQLNELVWRRRIALAHAQRLIAENWIAAHRRYVSQEGVR